MEKSTEIDKAPSTPATPAPGNKRTRLKSPPLSSRGKDPHAPPKLNRANGPITQDKDEMEMSALDANYYKPISDHVTNKVREYKPTEKDIIKDIKSSMGIGNRQGSL